ncbi:MAG: tannase/feruloyl esterase family alpha/beta hydrolase [Acidobacteriota bacterium]|jgi:feruloyl esterase|nr:tannase/feruloyl esterase family alpha/beta hydrolase [Acidobacteriota bacterium]
MRRPAVVPPLAAIATFFVLTASQAAFAQQSCESLKSIKLPNVTFTNAEAAAPGWEMPAQTGFINTASQKIPVAFCRVEGYATPTSDSRIGFEVWLPIEKNWNGKFLAAGNPGFIGSLPRGALSGIMQRGYVAAATDTGHVDETAKWAIGHPEKWADWGYRAVHETAVVAKRLARDYYGRPVEYSYWNSCHNGGNQGLAEAQRYPDDFDGIVAADPAFNISRLQPGTLYLSWVSLKDGLDAPGYIPPSKYTVLRNAALAACDENDGLKDGIITDPPRCKFDPAVTLCKDGDKPDCLTAPQLETARKIYEGAKFKDGTQIFSGMAPGSELQWNLVSEKEPFWVNVDFFKGMVFEDLNWDWKTFDVDRDTRLGIERTGKYVDNNNSDLRPFKNAGGKIIIYHSWNSVALPTGSIVKYYEDVVKTVGGLKETQDFARLFVIPESGGCVGAFNDETFNAFKAVQDWVEKGIAPEAITYVESGPQRKVSRTRPVCAYPKISRYKGSGDPNDGANFTCVDPK